MAAKAAPQSNKHAIIRQVAIYSSIFALLMSLVLVGYRHNNSGSSEVLNSGVSTNSLNATSAVESRVDDQTATGIAANFAMQTQSAVAANVANLSTSLKVEQQLAQTDNSVISKPQIVQPTADNRQVKDYTAKEGDTIATIADANNVSADTIKWANDIDADSVDPGRALVIPPTDGVLYVPADGDTAESIAEKYNASVDSIISYNDLEVSGVQKDVRIMIPGGVKPNESETTPAPDEGATAAPAPAPSVSPAEGLPSSNVTASVGNKYAYGYCTFYVYERRPDIGSYWGNATSWAASARAAGFVVSNTPRPGSIFQYGGGYGHVGIVESVDFATNTMQISDMNGIAGFGQVGYGTVPINNSWNYIY